MVRFRSRPSRVELRLPVSGDRSTPHRTRLGAPAPPNSPTLGRHTVADREGRSRSDPDATRQHPQPRRAIGHHRGAKSDRLRRRSAGRQRGDDERQRRRRLPLLDGGRRLRCRRPDGRSGRPAEAQLETAALPSEARARQRFAHDGSSFGSGATPEQQRRVYQRSSGLRRASCVGGCLDSSVPAVRPRSTVPLWTAGLVQKQRRATLGGVAVVRGWAPPPRAATIRCGGALSRLWTASGRRPRGC
jgi:hypothetical protein